MIIVTGTKRSGTSMLMQILAGAGLPTVGEAFPADWGETLRAANPEGFFESRYRDGIHFMTNPDPRTGAYLHPADVRRHVVKVFVPGLVRTDLAFVDRVVANVRDFREFDASVRKLQALERAKAAERRPEGAPRMAFPEPYLEWWSETFALLADSLTRRYPLRLFTTQLLVEKPAQTIEALLEHVGGGELAGGLEAVHSDLRRNVRHVISTPAGVDPRHASLFDELYERVHRQEVLDVDFIDRMNHVHAELLPRIAEDARRVERAVAAIADYDARRERRLRRR